MSADEIIARMRDGYTLTYYAVTDGQSLERGCERIGLSFEDFDAARKDPRVFFISRGVDGVSRYGLAEAQKLSERD